MTGRIPLFFGMALAVVAGWVVVPCAHATDVFWDRGAGTDAWGAVAGANQNWSSNFTPEAAFSERGVVGTDRVGALLDGSSIVSAGAPAVGGIALGYRERVNGNGALVNPTAPAAGTLMGTLTISGGNIDARTTGQASFGADGRTLVGFDGRGYLIMTGGRLRTTRLTTAGEDLSTGPGRTKVDLSGSAQLLVENLQNNVPQNVNNAAENTATFSRDLVVTGPNVIFTTFGRLTLASTNHYTANITSATDHSVLRTTDNIAVVSGGLSVNFSGAGDTNHAIGESWDLVDSPLAIAGNFSGLGVNDSVAVTGLTTPAPNGTQYRLRKISDGSGQTIQLVKDRLLVAMVNRDTGQITIENRHPDAGAQDPGAIQIDGYTIASGLGSMLPSYSGISGQVSPPDTGWIKPVDGSSQPLNTVNVLTEVKEPIFSPPSNPTFSVAAVSSFSIGNGFSKTGVAANVANFGTDGEDLVFTYSTPDGVFQGHVEYTGTTFENNMVLRVNPTTGQAFLKNDSLETLTFDGYSITSSTGSLTGGAPWTGITDAGWQKSPATASALSQTNPTGSLTLTPNAEVALGDIGAFTTQAAQDGLGLKFILSVGLEGTGGPTPGDFDNDGDVDGRDFLVWQRNTSVGNLSDWQANYGTTGGGGANPPETTFRTGSVVFDATAGLTAALSAVPEPSTAVLLASIMCGMAFAGRVRPGAASGVRALVETHAEEQTGVSAMSRRMNWCAALLAAVCVFLGFADRSAAVTQGFALMNHDFELPGPAGTKVVAFGETGIPFAPTDPVVTLSTGQLAGGIPGWTFTGGDGGAGEACPGSGLGCETFPGTDLPGDSGTEGKGQLPGNEMILSTNDGKVFQTSGVSFPAAPLPATQKLLLTFEVHNIYTPTGIGELTAWIHYVDTGGNRQIIGTPTVTTPLGDFQTVTVEFAGGNSALTPALGRPIGVTFDTTSRDSDPTAVQSWSGVDNVLLEVAGTLAGDFNGDGSINLTDYAIIRDNLEEEHDFLFEGDIVRNGFVDLNDFRAWKSLPSVINSGVLAQIAAIPEPSSAILILGGMAMFGAFSRRRSGGSTMLAESSFPRRRESSSRRSILGSCGHRRAALVGGNDSGWNSKLLAVVAGLGMLSLASSASAALLYYDPILVGSNPAAGEYTLGSLGPEGGPGQNPIVGSFFTGPWDIPTADATLGGTTVRAEGLSFLGAPAAGGSLIANGSSRAFRPLTTPFDATTVGTYYISFLVNFGGVGVDPNSTDANAVGHRNIEMQVGANEGGNVRVGYATYNGANSGKIPSQAPLQAGPFGQELILDGGPASFIADNGSTHLVVFKFTMSDQPTSDTIEVFLNPTDNEEPVIASAAFFNRDVTFDRISGPVQFGGAGTSIAFDELRVADTFIDALPEFPLKGDTNGDDLVNMLDYQAIITHMNLTGQSTANGDVTGDGRVDLRDLRLWRDNRTDLPLSDVGEIGVPEPTSLALLVGSLAVLGLRRGRR